MHIPDDPLFYEKFYFTPATSAFARADEIRKDRRADLLDQWYPEGPAHRAASAEILSIRRPSAGIRGKKKNMARTSTAPGNDPTQPRDRQRLLRRSGQIRVVSIVASYPARSVNLARKTDGAAQISVVMTDHTSADSPMRWPLRRNSRWRSRGCVGSFPRRRAGSRHVLFFLGCSRWPSIEKDLSALQR